MKTKQIISRVVAAMIVVVMTAFVVSCKKDDKDPFAGDVNQTVSNESTQDSQQDEVDDIVVTQLNVGDPEGRIADGDDTRVSCAQITFEAGEEAQSGTLTINFDKNSNGEDNPNGCTDPRGNVRKGLISVNWQGGRWYHVGSIITVTLTNYSINGVVINGTRILTNITTNVLVPTWTIEASHTVQWPNSLVSARTVNKTRAWDIAAGTVTVTQTSGAAFAATGTTRLNREYTVTITQGLVYKISCVLSSKVFIPVSGVKVLEFKGKTVTIDFGSGDCDNSFTVTVDGKSRSEQAKNDGSDD